MANNDLTEEQLEARKKANERLNKTIQERIALARQEIEILEDEAEIYVSIEQQISIQNEMRQAGVRLGNLKIKELREELEKEREKGVVHQETVKKIHEEIALRKEQVENLKEQQKLLTNITSQTDNLISTFTGVSDKWKQTFVGSLVAGIEAGAGLGEVYDRVAESVKRTAKGAKRNFSINNLLGSTLLKVKEATLALMWAQDQALVSFNKAAGTMGEYNNIIVDTERNNRDMYLGINDVASAAFDLRKEFVDFRDMSASNAKETLLLTSQLQKLGIEGGITAKNMNTATKALFMTKDGALLLQKELFATAIAMGKPPAEVAAEFASAAPQLAAHGANMIGVFKGMQGAARATGIEFNDLLGIVGQFDTFEGAAQAAGTLNQILGGDLVNSVELLRASEEERIRLLIRGMEESGRSFAQMSKYDRLGVAQAAGINDMTVANKLFGQSLAAYDIQVGKAKAAQAEQAKLEKRMVAVTTAQEQFITVLKEFAFSMLPVLKVVKGLADGFLFLNKIAQGWLVPVLVIVLGTIKLLIIAFKLLNIALFKQIALWIASKAGVAGDTAARVINLITTKAQTEVHQKANKVTTASVVPMLAFAGAVALMGIGIGAAALGMAQFVTAFQGMPAESILAVALAIGVFMVGMIALVAVSVALAPASAAAAAGLIPLGIAIALIGVGVLAAAFGMSLLVKSLVQAFDVVSGNLTGFLLFIGALTVFSLLSPGLLLTFGILVPGLALMAASLFLIKTSDLEALGQLFAGISNITTSTATAMASVAMSIGQMVGDIARLDLEKMAALNELTPKVRPVTTSVASGGFAGKITEAARKKEESRSAGVQTVPKTTSGASTFQPVPINIIVKVNEKEIGKIAWEEVKARLDKAGSLKTAGIL